MDINVEGIPKARLLVGLFARAHQQGFGALDPNWGKILSVPEAQAILNKKRHSFDWLFSRRLNVSLSGEVIDATQYDHQNGAGAAAEVVSFLRREL